MAGRRRQAHFYDPATVNSLKGVPLPDKIRCGRCNKFKPQSIFSNKQLTDARQAVKSQGHSARYSINCQPCTGQQVVEIECCMCNKTKGLECFAKSQRKKPDSAKCFPCVEDQLAQEAIQEEVYESDDRSRAFIPADDSVATIPCVWTDSATTDASESGDGWNDAKYGNGSEDGGIKLCYKPSRKMSILSDIDKDTLIGTDDRSSQAGSNNQWQTVQSAKSWHTRSNRTPSTKSGFNPDKYGNPAARSINASVSGSVHTFSSGFAERSDTVSNRGGFAKIKAYDPKKDPDNKSLQKPVNDDWDSSPESESESEDDDDEYSDDDTDI